MRFNKPEALRQAQHFMREGNVSSAIAVYRKIVDAEPSDLVAISTLGDLYIKTDRVQDAVESFSRVAENYLSSGSDISARYILNKILKLDPENPSAQVRMAELCVREGNGEKAHEWLIEAGAAFWRRGDVNGAMEANQRALALNPESRHAKAALWVLQQEREPAPQEPAATTVKQVDSSQLQPILISITEDHDGVFAPIAVEPDISATPSSRIAGSNGNSDDEHILTSEMPIPLDEAVIIDHIANAELLAGYGQLSAAVATLRELLMRRPDHVEVRERLKDIYLRAERTDRASEECINIAAILAARGEAGRARDYLIRAQLLSHSAGPAADLSFFQTAEV